MQPGPLTQRLKEAACNLGFSFSGACPAVTPRGLHRFYEWLDAGHAGEMEYLPKRRDAYSHPNHVLPGARSLLLLALDYRTASPNPRENGYGRVSRYAWGTDYHDLIHDRLNRLVRRLAEIAPQARARGIVDTAPLLEREFAQLAGLGWIGKNTLLLNREHGSWFFLAAILTDVVLEYDEPHETDFCGTCRACLDACPTQAFVAPYVLDSQRCISYLTIELRSQIPLELRGAIGDWVLGCDICQEVCPWNNKAPASAEPALAPANGMNPLALAALFELDDEAFRSRFRHTPFWRPKRRGLLRNAAIVLGNQQTPQGIPPLERGLADVDPLVRGACAWALGCYREPRARRALEERLALEVVADVREEIESALTAPG